MEFTITDVGFEIPDVKDKYRATQKMNDSILNLVSVLEVGINFSTFVLDSEFQDRFIETPISHPYTITDVKQVGFTITDVGFTISDVKHVGFTKWVR